MYKISVPLVRYNEFREENLAMLRRFGAERVFLCPGRGLGTPEENSNTYRILAENIKFYTDAGYEVGVWINTIGHGGDLVGAEKESAASFTKLVGLKGKSTGDSFCPLDPEFSKRVCDHIAAIARLAPKLIMLDDDYRLAYRTDCGCTCERHMKKYRALVGEDIAPHEVLGKAFRGGKNRYRDAWLDLMGDTLRDFARKMRAAVDSVDPSIRLGACSCISVWDSDGVDSIELARIFAGSTAPFMRLIGAAYWPESWSCPNDRLSYVAEIERMQAHWCREQGIELMCEGDAYPRPRYAVPAANLEIFDTIMRADGGLDGCLKYGVDYFSSAEYEMGYALRAERNKEASAAVLKAFDGKRAVGVGVSCAMKKIADKVFFDPESEIGAGYDEGFFSTEQQLLTNLSLPITYEAAPVTAIFGENARSCDISSLSQGVILDVAAARLLTERGLDVGFISAEPIERAGEFTFPTYNERTPLGCADGLMQMRTKEGSEILATYDGDDNKPAVVRYENADGLRVILLAYIGDKAKANSRIFRNYCLPKLLSELIEWAGRAPLAATCFGHPDLYILAKRDEGSLTVGLWNIFPDAVFTPTVILDRAYSSISSIGCDASINGNEVRLATDIPPYGFAVFTVFS